MNDQIRTKQEALDAICVLVGAPAMTLSIGSTVPAEMFDYAATFMGLSPDGSMPEIGEAIVRSAGLIWDEECDSRNTSSGGGSTVTLTGMRRILEALERRKMPATTEASRYPTQFGQRYVEATGGNGGSDKLFEQNWDALDKATRLHSETQNRLEGLVRSRGLRTVSPRPGTGPQFDLGWTCASGLVVVEVKTTNPGNQCQQVRLGLGQVLDYRWALTQVRSEHIIALLATSSPLGDAEIGFCAAVGVRTTSTSSFEDDLEDLLLG